VNHSHPTREMEQLRCWIATLTGEIDKDLYERAVQRSRATGESMLVAGLTIIHEDAKRIE
jgi:hypothetical protein